jgi:hypothetical protein
VATSSRRQVKLYLRLKYHAIYRATEVKHHAVLTLPLNGGKQLVMTLKPNFPSEKEPTIPIMSKVNVKFSLCLTNWALRHEDGWGSGCIDPCFLDLGTSLRWVVSFSPQLLYPGERDPGTHSIGCWVGPRAGLDEMEKWKFLTLPGLELWSLSRPACSQSLCWLRYSSYYLLRVDTRKYTNIKYY